MKSFVDSILTMIILPVMALGPFLSIVLLTTVLLGILL